jgi:hypothetical protein
VKEHERTLPWLSTRYGKSRDHALRLCALLQGLEMAAVVCHDLILEEPAFGNGVADKKFLDAVVAKTKQLFYPTSAVERKLSINVEVVRGSIYLTNKIIEQYQQMFEPNKKEIRQVTHSANFMLFISNSVTSFFTL